jgi:hypothetical protein
MADKERNDHFDSSSMDGRSVAELLKRIRTNPEYKSLLDLRKKRSIHLFQGFTVDATLLKLSCLLFDHVTITELAKSELEYLDDAMSYLESGGRTARPIRLHARAMIRKARHFQEETKILRDEEVLAPFQWQGGRASMFQPASLVDPLNHEFLFLGDSEMNALASFCLETPFFLRQRKMPPLKRKKLSIRRCIDFGEIRSFETETS